MSTQSVVEVLIRAKDLLTPQLAGLKQNILSVGGAMDVFKGTLMANGTLMALQAAQQGFSALQSTVMSTAKTQTLGLAQAGDLASQLQVSFGKAKDIVAETRIEISKMAAALPGENKDYNAINTQISATVAGYSKGNIAKFKEDSLELTKRFGILASIRGVDANMGGSSLNRVLSGTMGIGEAFGTVDMFQKNPLLRKFLDEQLKIIGKSENDWKSLTTEARAKILRVASKQAASDETLAAFDGTVDSIMALAQTTLFDADTGVFGFLKQLKAAGGRSGLDSIQGAMQAFSNLFSVLGRYGSKLGLSLDTPMLGIIAVVDWFRDVTNTTTGILNGGSFSFIEDLFTGIVTGINGSLGNLDKFMYNLDWVLIGKGLAKALELGIKTIFSINYLNLTSAIVSTIAGLFVTLASLVTEVFKDAAKGGISGISKAIYDSGFLGSNDPNAPWNKNLLQVGTGTDLDRARAANPDPFQQFGDWIYNIPALGGLKSTPLPSGVPRSNKQSFAPTVNVTGAQGSPQEVASAVLGAINSAYIQYSQGSLA